MNLNIQELAVKRQNWVDANRENGFEDGIKRLLTELYPDNAHFIYELLQNAEDACAEKVRFILNEDQLLFEHDGKKLFDIQNVEAITSIGFSTKRDDTTTIGKFGVGFKAVFAYTKTPEVESGAFHFRIKDMVVPEAIHESDTNLRKQATRFVIPFDNPKKSKERAKSEVKTLLETLNETTLLFLSNIQKIEYQNLDSQDGYIERVSHSGNIMEVRVKSPDEASPASTWYLKFEKNVQVEDEEAEEDKDKTKNCRVGIAFGIKPVVAEPKEDDEKKADGTVPYKKWELVQMNPGKVCIYFPADKETSNLRFHLHAPFASTVARDSVRDSDGNDQLRDHLGDLLAESMHVIRDQGILNVQSLAVLPNEKDNLTSFYRPLMQRLVDEFRDQPLVPMKQGGFAPARDKFRGSKGLSDLIDDNDLVALLGDAYEVPIWTANPPQRYQREDNFLLMLGISEWKNENLVEILVDTDVLLSEEWLLHKSNAWHQCFYSHLVDHADYLRDLKIVKISDDSYRAGKNSYFPTDGIEYDHDFPRVSKTVYNISGSSKEQREKARRFLINLGVREVDEQVEIESVLKKYYSVGGHRPKLKLHLKHMGQILNYYNGNSKSRLPFKSSYLLLGEGVEKDEYCLVEDVYLDDPYAKTGLNEYFETHNTVLGKQLLAKCYKKSDLFIEDLIAFVMNMGGICVLPIEKSVIPETHPELSKLSKIGGKRNSDGYTDVDYGIKYLPSFLEVPSIQKSKLLWKTLQESYGPDRNSYLHARFGRNKSHINMVDSTLVLNLRLIRWIPQQKEDEIEFVAPRDALAEFLPDGLEYDNGWPWLQALQFGDGVAERKEEARLKPERETAEYKRKDEVLKDVGFESPEKAEEIALLIKENPEEFIKFQATILSRKERPVFPERTVANPERRQERLGEQLSYASDKEYEKRQRSVRTSASTIDSLTWLRSQYMNDKEQMICQICKEEMPFLKRDGTHYFEKIEVLSRDFLSKEFEAQFLALCPICAAKYHEFIRNVPDEMTKLKNTILSAEGSEISIFLGKENTSIRFVETHLHDLKTILESQP